MRYTVTVEVDINDLPELRAYALHRAITLCDIDEAEFETGEHPTADGDVSEHNIRYWLAWAFDAGTPPLCGFQIENSTAQRAEFTEYLDDCAATCEAM
jgi:hypothetical protein